MEMDMALIQSVVGLLLLMLLLILIIVLLACKPWQFFSSFYSRNRSNKDDLEKPLFCNDMTLISSQGNDLASVVVGSSVQNEGHRSSVISRERNLLTDSYAGQGASLVLDVISDPSEDLLADRTLKQSSVANWPAEIQKHVTKDEPFYDSPRAFGDGRYQISVQKVAEFQRSCLTLEVISGHSCGLRCSLKSTNFSQLPLTLGRVPPSDLILKDSEVSGKHALINWNLNKLKWELTDMGSLNGTHLNSREVQHPDSGCRHWSEPIEIASGDIITLGTASKILVHITPPVYQIPFGVGIASDPMALRRGGKKLPMEDVCYFQWPLPEVEQFGLFGIFDGHGGVGAAKTASKTLPKMVANLLSISDKRKKILSHRDASEVLKDAFFQTEAAMNHQYEGCTATVLLVWADHHEDYFAQCANVGDSACVLNVGEKQMTMTEDHRVTSPSEKARFRSTGQPITDDETRLCGLNIARMLGDKFLKEQESRFSSEPYVSQCVHITKGSKAYALMASDGLWDVISIRKAVQLARQAREKFSSDQETLADRVANFVLSEAKTLRTKDNTSVIFLNFDINRVITCN
ncbi:protein phosphatase 2C 70-like [Aristolochia californica]|uniref:protein phosphatase 2C 70-like n=1 Tax=Aristolochia californica TaxID=171875 RepID=UPI0035D86FF7